MTAPRLLRPIVGKKFREDRAPDAGEAARSSHRWAIVLAGGDGVRLRGLTRLICGDDRPKQFFPLLDGGTLLGHTVRRAELRIPTAQILFALTHPHWNYEDALMAVLPSDHYYSDEACFTAALESAFKIAANRPESVVLIGAQPSRPEVEYGWIELGAPVGNESGELCRVREFWEKPSIEAAETLLGEHSAWNTFVMVGRASAFLEMAAQAIPMYCKQFGGRDCGMVPRRTSRSPYQGRAR